MVVIIVRGSDSLHRQLVRRVAQPACLGILLLLLGNFAAGLRLIILLLLLMRWLRQAALEIPSLLAAAVLGALVLLVKVSENLIEFRLHFLNLNIIILFLCRAILTVNFTIILWLHCHILSVFC